MPADQYLNREADVAIHQGMATEERLAHLDAALKDCIQQISSLQIEREMEADLKEANKRLICSLVCKQELIDELERDKHRLEAELDALMTTFDSVEKENAFLKCECCALERELVLKVHGHEEKEDVVNRDPSQKSSRKIDILVDRLCDVEEENKALRGIIEAREDELCSSKLKCAQVAYRLAVLEADRKDVDDNAMIQLEDSVEQGVSENSLMNHFMKDSENQFGLLLSKQTIPVFQADATRTKGCWPWNVLDVIFEELQVSKRSINELLEEIQVSLAPQSSSETSGLLPLGQTRAKPGESDLNRSICRMIELIEEIIPPCLAESLTKDKDEFPTGTNLDYLVHVFRWRNSELIPILRKFMLSCSLVLNGSHGLNEFAMQLASALEWAVENCITLEEASRVRDKVRKHFNLDRSRSESEINVNSGDCQNVMTKMIKIQSDLQEENKWLKLKLKSVELANKELEKKLSLGTEKNELLMSQLEESKERIARLQEEVEDVKESRGVMEDQIEHLKSINEDLDTQLTVAKVKQNQMMHKLSSLEVEFEDKNQSCEELETTCLELQLQLEILSRKGSPYLEEEQMVKNKQIGWKMISDCSKLTLVMHETCKESDPSDECDKGKGNQHYSLRDRMLADDDDDDDGTKTKERVCVGEMEKAMKHHPDTDENKVLAVVPIKKQGGGFGFIRKIFLRRRKCGTNKASTLLQSNASTIMR